MLKKFLMLGKMEGNENRLTNDRELNIIIDKHTGAYKDLKKYWKNDMHWVTQKTEYLKNNSPLKSHSKLRAISASYGNSINKPFSANVHVHWKV